MIREGLKNYIFRFCLTLPPPIFSVIWQRNFLPKYSPKNLFLGVQIWPQNTLLGTQNPIFRGPKMMHCFPFFHFDKWSSLTSPLEHENEHLYNICTPFLANLCYESLVAIHESSLLATRYFLLRKLACYPLWLIHVWTSVEGKIVSFPFSTIHSQFASTLIVYIMSSQNWVEGNWVFYVINDNPCGRKNIFHN